MEKISPISLPGPAFSAIRSPLSNGQRDEKISFSDLVGDVLAGAGLCALAPPAFTPEVTAQVTPSLTLQMVHANPDAYKGQVVLVGGRIEGAQITPPDGVVELEVDQRPLDSYQKPIPDAPSQGRFLVEYKGPDFSAFRRERLIAVVGEIQGMKPQYLTKIPYPVVWARAINIWPRPAESELHPLIYYPWEKTPLDIRGRRNF